MILKHKIGEYLREFVAPNHCLITGEPLPNNRYLSQKALDRFSLAPEIWELTSSKLKTIDDFYLDGLFGLVLAKENSEFMDVIYQMKYLPYKNIGIELGELLGKKINLEIEDTELDLIVPIPIHKLKKRERGFNQSDYIAKGVSKFVNVDFKTDSVIRTKFTSTQTNLNSKQRQKNVKGVFEIKTDFNEKNLLICDDVYTTGSTMNQLAKALKSKGANKIYGASIVIA